MSDVRSSFAIAVYLFLMAGSVVFASGQNSNSVLPPHPSRGITTTGKCAGTSHEAGGNGHQNGKHGGQSQFSFSYDDSDQTTGSASYTDSGSGVVFQATQVTAATFDSVAHTVTLTGSGTDNGRPVTFTIVASDSSLVPPGSFTITLTDGYTNTGNLLEGKRYGLLKGICIILRGWIISGLAVFDSENPA